MAYRAYAFFAAAAAAGLIGSLLACGDAPVTSAQRRIEDPWAIAQSAGVLPLVVAGRPAFASPVAVEDAVLRAVAGAMTWTANPPVTLASAASAGGDVRLVFAFNDGAGDLCAGVPAGGEPRSDGKVSVLAVLCDGGEWLARVDGRLRRSDGIDGRRLSRLIGQATRELLAPPAAPRP